jgi:choline dehydrogenase-like flavoprotein
MTQEDRNRADARFNKATRAASGAHSGKTERDAALKAVTDNMAKLKALRLAREAAEPPRPAAPLKKTRAKSKKSDEKGPALADWLANQQSGGRRT